MGTDWAYAERQIYQDTGQVVSFYGKGKPLDKFGLTANADMDVETTVAQFQSNLANETFATTNSVGSLICEDAGDAGKQFRVEGMEFNTSRTAWRFAAQTVTATGQTPAPLSPVLCRATRMFVTGAGTVDAPLSPPAGRVFVYDPSVAASPSGGVPDDATATKVMLLAGQTQSRKCATATSYRDWWGIEQISASIARYKGGAALVEVDLLIRAIGGVWRPAYPGTITLLNGVYTPPVRLPKPALVPPNHDIKLVARSDANDTIVYGTIFGRLGIVKNPPDFE